MNDNTVSPPAVGALVRVEFVKESSKQRVVHGNFYTQDPESGSLVLAQPAPDNADGPPSKFMLIPGSSILQVLPEDQPGEHQLAMVPELDSQMDKLFKGADEAADCETKKTHEAHQPSSTTTPKKRTFEETLNAFKDFVQQRRHRMIDALNKYGIKFKEEPYRVVPCRPQNVVEQSPQQQQSEQRVDTGTTVLVLQQSGMKIFPPYMKSDLVGGSARQIRDLYLKLVTEDVFGEHEHEHFRSDAD